MNEMVILEHIHIVKHTNVKCYLKTKETEYKTKKKKRKKETIPKEVATEFQS